MAVPAERIPKPFSATVIQGGREKTVRLDKINPLHRLAWVDTLDLRQGPKATLAVLVRNFFNVDREDAWPSVGTLARIEWYKRSTILI